MLPAWLFVMVSHSSAPSRQKFFGELIRSQLAYHCAMVENLESAARVLHELEPEAGSEVGWVCRVCRIVLWLAQLTLVPSSCLKLFSNSMLDHPCVDVKLVFCDKQLWFYCMN